MPALPLTRLADYAHLAATSMRAKTAAHGDARLRAQRHLAARLGKMRGLPQKLGQMLSFGAASLEAETPFDSLREAAPPLPLEVILPELERAWRQPTEQVLAEIAPRGLAASLGQVHLAKLRDGRPVAIKVRYPGIEKAVMADLKMLGWLGAPLGALAVRFDMPAYQRTVLDCLRRELDYREEARQQAEFHQWSLDDESLVVPQVVEPLSGDNILVSTFEQGDTWDEARQWPQADRRRLAETLLRFFLRGLLCRGLVHADWHPGNFRFRRDGGRVRIVLYDFGCVYRPDEEERLAWARLAVAASELPGGPAGGDSPWPLFLKLGFKQDLLAPVADRLPALCRLLFEPFSVDHPYDLADWRLGERAADILHDDRWNFRAAGPPRLAYLLRAFHGLTTYLTGLQTPIRWRPALEEAIAPLKGRLRELPALVDDRQPGFSAVARYLKIRVCQQGQTKVQLTQPSRAIDRLDELLDDELKRRIAAKGVDLKRLQTEVRRRAYAAGELFRLQEEDKTVEAWLE